MATPRRPRPLGGGLLGMCGALERAATSISGPRAARALAGGAERLESTSVWILFHISPVIGGSCGRELGRQACALPSGAQQCKLDLTSCDRRGRDALAGCGGAVRGCQGVHPGRLGEPNARDMPCPKPAAFPTLRRSTPSSISPAASGAQSDASARRCGRAGPSCSAEGLRQRHTRAAIVCLVLRHHPWRKFHEPAGVDERPARRSAVCEALLIATGPLRRPLALWRHDGGAGRTAAAREGVLLVSSEGE